MINHSIWFEMQKSLLHACNTACFYVLLNIQTCIQDCCRFIIKFIWEMKYFGKPIWKISVQIITFAELYNCNCCVCVRIAYTVWGCTWSINICWNVLCYLLHLFGGNCGWCEYIVSTHQLAEIWNSLIIATTIAKLKWLLCAGCICL